MSNILIVDDERNIRKLLSSFLEDAGHTCWTAENVPQAKEMLSSSSFDLLLSDINMPGESGISLSRFVKETYPFLPIVIVSIVDNPTEAKEALDLDIYGYIVKPFTRRLVLITVENALIRHRLELQSRAYQEELENKVLEQTKIIKASAEKYRQIVDNVDIGIALFNPQLEILQMNRQMRRWFSDTEPNKCSICQLSFPTSSKETPCENCTVEKTFAEGKSFEITIQIEGEQRRRYFRDQSFPIHDENGKITAAVLLIEEVTEKLSLEQELRQSQKLEAIGQLAAGIAHEINSPVQYIGDNTGFLDESFGEIVSAFSAYDDLLQAIKTGTVTDEIVKTVEEQIEESDLAYLIEEIPRAIEQSLEGVKRVTGIVQAMREFSHPGNGEKEMVDINRAINNTITVARNEWKYAAEMKLDLDSSIPQVSCLPGEINQVLLNIIVNAAHAIADSQKSSKGEISISTCMKNNSVFIHINDTGNGIPKAIQHRIFDPFFTTKDVGKGTGQGLAIAHSVLTDKHGGSLSFETKDKEGTTFIIELPVGNEINDLL